MNTPMTFRAQPAVMRATGSGSSRNTEQTSGAACLTGDFFRAVSGTVGACVVVHVRQLLANIRLCGSRVGLPVAFVYYPA